MASDNDDGAAVCCVICLDVVTDRCIGLPCAHAPFPRTVGRPAKDL